MAKAKKPLLENFDSDVESIRQYIERHGLSQEKFAKIANVNPYTVNRWLRYRQGLGQAYREILRIKGFLKEKES